MALEAFNLENYMGKWNIPEIVTKFSGEQLVAELNARDFEFYPGNEDLRDVKTLAIEAYLKVSIRKGGFIGNDDRVDYCDIPTSQVLRQAQSVVLIVKKQEIDHQNGQWKYTNELTLHRAMGVCKSENFSDQRVFVAEGSGFLVDKDEIVTARHVANKVRGDLDNTIVLFAFRVTQRGQRDGLPQVQAHDVYRIVDIAAEGGTEAEDWARVKIRPYSTNRGDVHDWRKRVVTLSRDDLCVGTPVHMIGHPCGLPLKYAPNATVYKNNPRHTGFLASLDSYVVNSGSPVFRSDQEDSEVPVVVGVATDTYMSWDLRAAPDNADDPVAGWRPNFVRAASRTCRVSHAATRVNEWNATRCVKASLIR